MYGINVVAVLVAAAASLVASMVWYSIVGGSMAELQQHWRGAAAGSDRPMIWTLLVFATTSLVIATVVAVLFRLTGTTGLLPSVGLALGRIRHGRGCPRRTGRHSCRRLATPHGDHVCNHRSLALRGTSHEPVIVEAKVVTGAAVRDRT